MLGMRFGLPCASMRRGPDPILRTDLAGIHLATPVILAAGTAGVLDEMGDVTDLERLGAVVTKSITPRPRGGNASPRITWTSAGMLNAIGLANPGLTRFLEDEAPKAASMPCKVIASAAGFSVGDYERVAGALATVPGVAGVELNVSCPNVHGGTEFGADPGALREVVGAARAVVGGKPLLVKLSPVAIGTPHSIVDLATAAIEARADALCISNTIPAMGIDVRTRRPSLANVTGGLSGPAVRPVVVRLIHLVYRGVARDARVPIVGIGGISRWQHAAEHILAGATAVQVGAASFADPGAGVRIARGLAAWARGQGVSALGELVGAIETG